MSDAVMSKVITIDGPAGAGKSRAGALIAQSQNMIHLNTGQLYRVTGHMASILGIDLSDEVNLSQMILGMKIIYTVEGTIEVNGNDLSEVIRLPNAGQNASKVAAHRMVRETLLPIQREIVMAAKSGAVLDGRDTGTVVFKDAGSKFYLTASVNERRRRIVAEQISRGQTTAEAEGEAASILERDERDATRKVAPMKPASDAITVDCSFMNLAEVCATINSIYSFGPERRPVRVDAEAPDSPIVWYSDGGKVMRTSYRGSTPNATSTPISN